MIDKIKKNHNYKLCIGIVIGFLLSVIFVYGAAILSSSEVSYDNSKLGGNSDNVQGALEELYEKSSKCTTGSCSLTESNFYVGYTYNQTKGEDNYCVTGNEETCVRTDCYTSSSKICPPGTIIDYIVSGTNTRVRFHVMYDKGRKMIIQAQRNTIMNVSWYSSKDNTKGPLTALSQLESVTSGWTNVEEQIYTMGETIFRDNAFTGCDNYNSCTTNKYTLASRIAKARMITVQEVVGLGCTSDNKSCPIWMYNYLYDSTSYGGTEDDNTKNGSDYSWGYWTMSAYTENTYMANTILRYGRTGRGTISLVDTGVRAVVVVSK